ncbi:NAD-dependent DNA ligase LigA [Opitutaceae bacterium]|nr:NAD-dependent DNA ligase LigA [Opitutaceae bacterium]
MTRSRFFRISFGVLAWWCVLFNPLLAEEIPVEDLTLKIEQLRAAIAHHDDLYFREAAPEITDFEYDLLKLELRRLEQGAGVVSFTSGIGDDRSNLTNQIEHGQPMLSLDKAYSDEEVAEFLHRLARNASAGPIDFVVEAKFDGVAVNVVLDRGEFRSAATRGNGAVGEDITAQVEVIRSLGYEWEFDPSSPRIERIELRGEIYLANAQFDALNQERRTAAEPEFRHPRSVAAGAVNLTDLNEVASRGLSIVFHGWGDVYPADAAPNSMTEFYRWLDARGLPSARTVRFVTPEDAAQLNRAAERVLESIAGVPMDGVVIKVDSVDLQKSLSNGPTAPRWAIARKFAPPRARTVLRHIAWQVGRTGTLTPVAEFDPVTLGGATIRRASLSKAGEIIRRDLRLGDMVWIEKAGEIIPQLARIDYEQRSVETQTYLLPDVCPSCRRELTNRGGGKALQLVCEHYDCTEQVEQRLRHFVSKGALNIKGVGPTLAQRMVESGLVQCPSDLYTLTLEQLVALPRVGEKSGRRLLTAIDASRDAPLERWVIALGLPGVGPHGARQLAAEIRSLSELLNPAEREMRLSVLGETVSTQVEAYLRRPEIEEMLRRTATARSDPR